jgi:uncharacterized membrane protein
MNPQPAPGAKWTDERIEGWVASLLRGGVYLAAAVTTLGGIALLVRNGRSLADYRVFRGEPADLVSLHGVLSGLGRFESHAVVQFGLILLIATPVARVLVSLVAFVLQRDRLYVMITALVLAVLLFSFLLGGHL